MDFNDTQQEAEFRAKCRAWLEANAELKTKKTNSAKNMNVGNKSLLEAAAEWQKKKYDAGWAMIHWPKEFGGIGATPIERSIWAQEESKFNVPKKRKIINIPIARPKSPTLITIKAFIAALLAVSLLNQKPINK